MFIAFVHLPSLSVQFRVVFGTRIFERLEEDPTYIQKQNRTKKGDYDHYLQPKEWEIAFDSASESKKRAKSNTGG